MPATLREVFGVEGRAVNWGRVAMVFNAYLFSGLFFNFGWRVIEDLLQWGHYGSAYWPPPTWLYFSVNTVLFLTLAILLFRFIRSVTLVLALSAIVYAPLPLAVWQLFFAVPNESVEMIGLTWTVLAGALRYFVPLGIIALALRFSRKAGVALIAGSIVGGIAYALVYATLIVPEAIFLRFDLHSLGRLVLWASQGGLLWLGLHLTGGRPTAEVSPQLDRTRFLIALSATWGLSLYLGPTFLGSLVEQLDGGQVAAGTAVMVTLLLALGISGAVVMWVFVHRMWASIQDGHARTSPGVAVARSFIPVYQIYWIFVIFRGFAEDFNSYTRRQSCYVKPLPVALFTAFPVLFLLSVIPTATIPAAGLAFMSLPYFVFLAIVAKVCDAVNSPSVIAEELPRAEPRAKEGSALTRTDRPIFVWILSIGLLLYAVGVLIGGLVTEGLVDHPVIALMLLAAGVLGIVIWVGIPWVLVVLKVVWVIWCIILVLSALAASTTGSPDWSHALGLVIVLLLIPIWFDSVKAFFNKTNKELGE